MHSSRMRTGRSLTVWRGSPFGGGGGCLLPGGGGVVVPPSRGSGGLLPGGASLWGGASFLGVCGIPACTEADPPPVNRMTNRCKNITLATTSLRAVKILRLKKP